MNKPLILVTNDDGYRAKGINTLIEIAREFGEVVVVAPDGPQSGQSSAMTMEVPIRAILVEESDDFKLYRTTGKPVDCVKLALNVLLDRKPNLILSGINHGSNASINVIYSGTMGAAIEGTIVGIPSIGFSIMTHNADADFTETKEHCSEIIKEVLRTGLPYGTCLNVNMPTGKLKGRKFCRQSKGAWEKEITIKKDPRERVYYWLAGNYKNTEPNAVDTDIWALENGYISIVPTQCDMTDYEYLNKKQNK